MAPFPEVMLRVRFGRQQIFKNVEQCRTFENNRSSASSTSSSAVVTDFHRPDRTTLRRNVSKSKRRRSADIRDYYSVTSP